MRVGRLLLSISFQYQLYIFILCHLESWNILCCQCCLDPLIITHFQANSFSSHSFIRTENYNYFACFLVFKIHVKLFETMKIIYTWNKEMHLLTQAQLGQTQMSTQCQTETDNTTGLPHAYITHVVYLVRPVGAVLKYKVHLKHCHI